MNTRLTCFLVSLVFVCLGCQGTNPSEYEKASGIAIPANAKERESHDDGKLVKTTLFLVDSASLNSLIATQQFLPFRNENIPLFWGATYLQENPDYGDLNAMFYKSGTADKISWIYIADKKTGRLWTEIKYQGKPSY